MGATYVTVTVRNPAEPHRAWEGSFRVEPGVINCLAPRKYLESIGLAAKGQRNYRWADGSETLMDFTTAAVEFMDGLAGVSIMLADDDAEPLLGLTALASVGVEVDPETQALKKKPRLRMPGIRLIPDRHPTADR